MRKIFSQKNLHPNISKQVLEYHKEVINEVEEAIEENQIVIVGMRWNDAVWQARRNYMKIATMATGGIANLTVDMVIMMFYSCNKIVKS
jgi:hypothetical protein